MIAWFKRWRRERRIKELRQTVSRCQAWAVHYHHKAVQSGLKAVSIDMLARPQVWAIHQADHNRYELRAGHYRSLAQKARQTLHDMGAPP